MNRTLIGGQARPATACPIAPRDASRQLTPPTRRRNARRQFFVSAMKLSLSSALTLAVLAPTLYAATLRVPEDYGTIQRALFAADKDDTIVVAEGTYRENLTIAKPITLTGAGVARTHIVAPDWKKPVITAYNAGRVSLSELSFAHVDGEHSSDRERANNVATFSEVNVRLKNVRVSRAVQSGIDMSSCGEVVVENLSLEKVWMYGISMKQCKNISVDGIRADEALDNWLLYLDSCVGVVRNAHPPKLKEGMIDVVGASSHVRFEGASPEFLKVVGYVDAFPDGPPKDYVPETPSEEEQQEIAEFRAQQAAERPAIETSLRTAQKLMKEFQTVLSAAKGTQPHSEALIQLFTKLSQQPDAWYSPKEGIVKSELETFGQRFGVKELDALLPRLPRVTQEESQPAAEFFEQLLSPDLIAALKQHRASNTISDTFDLPQVLSGWKIADGAADPASAALAFYNTAKALSSKAETSSAEETKILKAALLKEVGPFVEKQGYPSLDELLTRLTQSPLVILTAQEIREQLTPQQKRAFAKFLVQ